MDVNSQTDNRQEANTNLAAFRKDFFNKFNHYYGVNWFHEEFKKAWNVDIYAYPFNKEEGHAVIEKDNMEILLLKMEKLDDSEEVLREFLELDHFSLIKDNMSEKKWYHSVYKEFKSMIKPSEEYINKLYSTSYMKHFYSNEEQKYYKNNI
ncbi:putative capsular polysaccharide synthesis family protein [Alteribacillus sp. HJP-4]|uniref:putative capsular polysaccharide synthesis family protein n=1 Tax=Alteribacillus sp. HJP-4 TaxID=2775394 RepID=UPI0035CCE45A